MQAHSIKHIKSITGAVWNRKWGLVKMTAGSVWVSRLAFCVCAGLDESEEVEIDMARQQVAEMIRLTRLEVWFVPSVMKS